MTSPICRAERAVGLCRTIDLALTAVSNALPAETVSARQARRAHVTAHAVR
jgi:hypothetical protein